MDTFTDLVATAMGVGSTVSLKIWLILKVEDYDYTGIYIFLYPLLYLLSYLMWGFSTHIEENILLLISMATRPLHLKIDDAYFILLFA